jgi:SPP1 family predicted phage head-tail adaptor
MNATPIPIPGISAGELNNRVSIETASTARDTTTGEAAPTFTSAFSCWAAVEPLNGRELLQAQAAQADVTHRVRVRYSSDTAKISPRDRIRMTDRIRGDRIFNILSVQNVSERRAVIQIMAREQTA